MGHNEPDYDADNPIYRGGQPVVETEYLTDALTREAVDFIRRHRERPFLLVLAYNAVHSPLQVTAMAMLISTSNRRSMRLTTSEASTAPSDNPPRSAPATRPTCSSEKPSNSTQAVLITGTPTSTA